MTDQKDSQFMEIAKASLPHFHDFILTALKAVKRNLEFSDLRRRLAEIFAQSKIFVLKNSGRTVAVPVDINGTTHTCALCFSSPYQAMLAWVRLTQTGETRGLALVVTEENSHKFFQAAVENGLHVYLNFQSDPEESYIFNAEETADFYLAAPWPLETDLASEPLH
jgi:hypothetical protein